MTKHQPLTAYQSPLLKDIDGLRHGFWGRKAGNVGRYKHDPDEVVLANRQGIVDQLGEGQLCLVKQVHGTRVIQLDSPLDEIIEADAMVTRLPGLWLGVQTADCLPVLMVHPASKTLAAVHSGWRGTTGGILQEVIRAMDVPAYEILAAVGPCVWQIDYTVGQDVYDAAGNSAFFLPHPTEEERYLYDPHGHMIYQMRQAGIEHISPSPANTYAQADDYFSFRRSTHRGEPCGNQLSAIGWSV
jgi:polyphenol oxidase